MFVQYSKEQPDFHKEVRNFQLEERHHFMEAAEQVADGEHQLYWSVVHQRFVDMIERHIKLFIAHSHCTELEFETALLECKRKDVSQWPIVEKFLSVSDYQMLSSMLQQNTCLCCGDPFIGYLPEELAQKLLEYVQIRPGIHAQVRDFQLRERHLFLDDAPVDKGEHLLQWTDVHQRFLQLIQVHVDDFLNTVHCSDEELLHALRVSSTSDSPALSLFKMLLNTTDYEGFASMLRHNVCLCCGQQFNLHEAAGA